MNLSKSISTLFFILVFYTLTGYRNTAAQEIISTAGDSHSNANGSISYTIGEPIIETVTEEYNILTQGMQQTNLVVTVIDELPGTDFEISAYPNPTSEFVTLKILKESITGIQYRLYDMSGRLLKQNSLVSNETEISFSDLFPAEYILRVSDNRKEVKSFKIIKIQ